MPSIRKGDKGHGDESFVLDAFAVSDIETVVLLAVIMGRRRQMIDPSRCGFGSVEKLNLTCGNRGEKIGFRSIYPVLGCHTPPSSS